MFANFSTLWMCKRAIYSIKCWWDQRNSLIAVLVFVLCRKHVFYNLLSIIIRVVGVRVGGWEMDGHKTVLLA